MLRRVSLVFALLSTMFVLAGPTPASAFTTAPHEEILGDAMAAEGFGSDAITMLQLDNTFTDLYQWVGASANPYSGHADALNRLFVQNFSTENWSIDLVAAATRSHFDSSTEAPVAGRMPTLGTTKGITAEWDRLRRSVCQLVREAREEDDPELLLAVLGSSLHEIQDFYAHTNWIEPRSGSGADGPGWQERGFGNYPTWFDVPADQREAVTIYGDTTPGHTRTHGYWATDGNTSLTTGMNKDGPTRPYYLPAAVTAYFATRQWTEAVRSWVADEGFWKKAQSYQGNERKLRLEHERLENIMRYSGRWEGQGEPNGGPSGVSGVAGDLLELRAAVKQYFQKNPKSRYRTAFERMIKRLANPNPLGQLNPVPSSQDLQRSMRIVVLRVLSIRSHGLGDPGPDDADMYARAWLDGQEMHSDVIHGQDAFNFPKPYAPITMFKVVPAVADRGEPVESIEVEVKTASAHWAGTDDDVFLRINGVRRFPLDKRLYDDFESGDRDTYSVPIDDAVRNGLEVGDISRVAIEKSGDGISGGWKLGGVKVLVNGRVVYSNQDVNRWLEDDSRVWTAKDFEPRNPRGEKVPIVLSLEEDDSVYGGDDQGDINPFDNRDVLSFGYIPGGSVEETAEGGNQLMGRWPYGGDRGSLIYRLETLTPELMRPRETPEAVRAPVDARPAGQPDLVITDFAFNTVTVTNRGPGPAGPFRLRAAGSNREDIVNFPGLAPGASETRPVRLRCDGFYFAIVDDLEQIDETDETNNEATSAPVIC
jgi:hypothetical protein